MHNLMQFVDFAVFGLLWFSTFVCMLHRQQIGLLVALSCAVGLRCHS